MPTNPRKGLLTGEPMKLLDFLLEKYQIKNDRQLGLRLGLKAPTLSKIRAGRSSVSAAVILAIHKEFKMPVKDIEALL
jgi:transcriptional regulator with XRE-family HTH domain